MRLYLLALLIIPITLYGQAKEGSDNTTSSSTEKKNSKEKYPKVSVRRKTKISKKLIKDGSFYNAAMYLEDVLKAKPTKIKVAHQLAEINRSLRDYVKAEKFYKQVLTLDAKKYPNDQFFYAQMLKMNGKYEDATTEFGKYIKAPIDKEEKSYKALAKVESAGCDSALVYQKLGSKIKVEHETGSIVNPITDYAPHPMKDGGIMYSSLKNDSAVNITESKYDYYSKIYTAKKQGDKWVDDKPMAAPPNDSKMHVGNGVLSDDEKTLYFTKCDQKLIETMLCKIFKCTKEGSEWSNPIELKELDKKGETATATQPALGVDKDGKPILYFSTNRGGGKGGMDIWYARLNDDGSVGEVKNAGAELNTAGDEMTPWYDKKTGTLYFSSNGHPTVGGLDVFKIKGTPDSWTSPVMNMQFPVNSQADDLYFVLDDKGTKGYVVSNREGTMSDRGTTCCDDIWDVIIKTETTLKGIYVMRNDLIQKPVVGVEASMYKVDGKNFEFVNSVVSTGEPFYFPVKPGTSYKMNGNKEGFWPAIDNITINANEDRDTVSQIFYIDPIIKKKVRIENIYFQFDKSDVITFYQTKIDSVLGVLKANPGYSVEVQGHTDSKGSDEYNEVLSKKRAEAAKKYLEDKGVAAERIIVKTFGEKSPIAPNETPDGKDDPEGRARNRRVEFKLIPDKPEDAPEIETVPGDPVPEVKTGPGFDKK